MGKRNSPSDAPDRVYARAVKSYRTRRAKLIEAMGGACMDNDGTCSGRLEFDHIDPASRTWVARELGRCARIKRYEEEHARRVLVLRCRSHNARKGKQFGRDAQIMAAHAEYARDRPEYARAAADDGEWEG